MPSPSATAILSSAPPVFGAIDLGTNNCRMLAATPAPGGFRVVDSFSRVVRLGEGLAETGRLSQDAMDRTVAALAICADKFRQLGTHGLRAVATEACRQAANADVFLARVEAETDLRIDVVSGIEEARLTLAGCAPLLAQGPEHVLLFDIGGGSTEVVWAQRLGDARLDVIDTLSLPVGVVTLTEQTGTDAQADARANAVLAPFQDALAAFDERLAIAERMDDGLVRMIGTSGTVTTLAALQLGLRHYDRASVDGEEVSRVGIEDTGRAVARMSVADRAAHPCIGTKRADLVVAGIKVMNAVLARWPAESLLIADRGIREGLLLDMTAQEAPR